MRTVTPSVACAAWVPRSGSIHARFRRRASGLGRLSPPEDLLWKQLTLHPQVIALALVCITLGRFLP